MPTPEQPADIPITNPPRVRRRWLRWGVTATLLVLAFLWYIGELGGNVHTVVPGVAYRSAQLTGGTLDAVLDRDHIGTVINLRGGKASNSFYASELQECRKYGAAHIDIAMSSSKLPTPDEVDRLIAAFDTAKRPILIHCQAGADRTGLASTIFAHLYGGEPMRQAEAEQLTWRHGHFSFGRSHAMNDFFAMYFAHGQGMPFRQWVSEEYPSLYVKAPRDIRSPDAEIREYVARH